MGERKTEILRGTLDMLILKALSLNPMHGLGVARRLDQITGGVFQVKPGSLFPALHRLEQEGWIEGEWSGSESNRKAKYYRLTRAGRERLGEEQESWSHVVLAITRVLETT